MIRSRNKSIKEQVASLKRYYPQFRTSFTSPSSMLTVGFLQPTARSCVYHFELRYSLSGPPKTKILSPTLKKRVIGDAIPHMYEGENLCLYQPKYFEFKRTHYLSHTIIPWTSLWLYHYEVWHLTDEWLGGGEHQTIQN